MDAKAAIVRMCELQERVSVYLNDHGNAADCFCGNGGYWRSAKNTGYDGTEEKGYRNDGVSIEFIEAAVEEKIQRETRPPEDTGRG